MNVRLWKVTGSSVNTALIPIFINLVQQLNDIVFLIGKKEKIKWEMSFGKWKRTTYFETQFARIFWFKIVQCRTAWSSWTLLCHWCFCWWTHWRWQRWCCNWNMFYVKKKLFKIKIKQFFPQCKRKKKKNKIYDFINDSCIFLSFFFLGEIHWRQHKQVVKYLIHSLNIQSRYYWV